MINHLLLFLFPLFLFGCSPSMLEGEVVSSRDAGQDLMEYFVKTTDKSVPYLKIRTNKPALSIGSKVFLDISYFKRKA